MDCRWRRACNEQACVEQSLQGLSYDCRGRQGDHRVAHDDAVAPTMVGPRKARPKDKTDVVVHIAAHGQMPVAYLDPFVDFPTAKPRFVQRPEDTPQNPPFRATPEAPLTDFECRSSFPKNWMSLPSGSSWDASLWAVDSCFCCSCSVFFRVRRQLLQSPCQLLGVLRLFPVLLPAPKDAGCRNHLLPPVDGLFAFPPLKCGRGREVT